MKLLTKNYFTLSEYCITDRNIPQHIADAILLYHIIPMNRVREAYGKPILVSQGSGWRPYDYELSKGRPGTSQHTFKLMWPEGKGAADYTAADLEKVRDLIFEHTNYQRVGFYPHHNFIHCDYKPMPAGKRGYYEADKNKKWHFIKYIK